MISGDSNINKVICFNEFAYGSHARSNLMIDSVWLITGIVLTSLALDFSSQITTNVMIY